MAVIWSYFFFFFVVGVSVCPSCILFICQKEVGKDMSGNNSIIVGRVWPFLGTSIGFVSWFVKLWYLHHFWHPTIVYLYVALIKNEM
jgi:hypothetical protein